MIIGLLLQGKHIPERFTLLISIKKMNFYFFQEVKMEIFSFGIFEISVKK